MSVQDIQDVFFRTQTFRLYLVTLSPSFIPDPSSGSSIISLPGDLLQDKRAENIFLICPPNASPSIGLTIDPAAFEFTRFDTSVFGILNCDLAAQTDMQFLTDFSVLNTLRFENTLNLQVIESLPSLPALKKLIISGCTGLDEKVAFPDLTPARLQRLYLNGNALSDQTANGILVSVGSSSSASSLQELILANDGLTRIPRIASFSKLSVYDVSYNVVPFMSQLTLDFGAVVTLVSLKSNSLTAIEGGAFQGIYGVKIQIELLFLFVSMLLAILYLFKGDFTYAQVNLENNNLSEFRSDVFLSMLQQMATPPSGSGGEVLVTGSNESSFYKQTTLFHALCDYFLNLQILLIAIAVWLG